jgi:hypothetical protein
MGYHINEIQKGVLGEFSKIREEFLEFEDAHLQGNKVLQICELCDLVGAIKAYADRKFKLTLEDLDMMERATAAAFKDGTRISNCPQPDAPLKFRVWENDGTQ